MEAVDEGCKYLTEQLGSRVNASTQFGNRSHWLGTAIGHSRSRLGAIGEIPEVEEVFKTCKIIIVTRDT